MSGETILWHVKILFFFKQHAVESFLCPADTFKFTIVAQTFCIRGDHMNRRDGIRVNYYLFSEKR